MAHQGRGTTLDLVQVDQEVCWPRVPDGLRTVIGVHVVLIIVDAGINGKLIGLVMDVDLFLREL